MEKQRSIKGLSLVALIVAVLGLTVAFASLSRTLTINGQATMDPATWDIHYVSGTLTHQTGGTATATDGSLAATAVSGLSVTLHKPGDTATYAWDVTNAGTIDAHIGTLTFGSQTTVSNAGLTCTNAGDNNGSSDATNVCNDVVITFKYASGAGFGQGVTVGDAVSVNDTLTVSEGTKHLQLTITYPSTVTNDTYPADDVTITIPTISTIYEQTIS